MPRSSRNPGAHITREDTNALLEEWASSAQLVRLFAFHGDDPKLITVWEGTIKAEGSGIFLHTSEHALNFVDIRQFREFIRTEIDGGYVGLHLRTPSTSRHNGLNVMLGIQKAGDLRDFPPITDWIQ